MTFSPDLAPDAPAPISGTHELLCARRAKWNARYTAARRTYAAGAGRMGLALHRKPTRGMSCAVRLDTSLSFVAADLILSNYQGSRPEHVSLSFRKLSVDGVTSP